MSCVYVHLSISFEIVDTQQLDYFLHFLKPLNSLNIDSELFLELSCSLFNSYSPVSGASALAELMHVIT